MVDVIRVKDAPSRRGQECTIQGWIYRIRSGGGIVFAIVRDGTGILQATVRKGAVPPQGFQEAIGATPESSVIIRGVIAEDKRALGGYELRATDFHLVSSSPPFPVRKGQSASMLLDNRHLWLRSRELNAILKIRAAVFGSIHEYFDLEGFIETQAPSFVSGACEGGATLFKVPYFSTSVYLTQSAQLYLEALITTLGRVYTVAPSFRAERSRTRRHLTEFWHAEAEAAWYSEEDMMTTEEQLVKHVCDTVSAHNEGEFGILGVAPQHIAIELPLERVTYEEALEKAGRAGVELRWGDDLDYRAERAITAQAEQPFFVTHYPKKAKAFYHRPDPRRPETVLCHDLLAPQGYGELTTGGERIARLDVLMQRIEEAKLDPKDYDWYIDLRRYGSVPHAGFGLGIDRLVKWITRAEHIQQVVPFPRTMRRMRP